MGIQTARPPVRGTFVEICRGSQVIVSRVVWSKGHRAGLRSQDAIQVTALVKEPIVAQPPSRCAVGQPIERRSAPRRVLERHDRSRLAGRAMEFLGLVIFVGAAAVTAFGAVERALAQPLSRIFASLD